MIAVSPLRLGEFPSLEAQAAALADDIAYNAHDIDDGLRAGLFRLRDVASVPYLGALLSARSKRAIRAWRNRARCMNCRRRVITRFVEDAILATGERLEADRIETAEDARRAGRAMFAFSEPMAEAERADQGVPVRPHVPPSAGQPHARRSRPYRARAVFGLCRAAAGGAGVLGGAGARSSGPSAPRPTISPA